MPDKIPAGHYSDISAMLMTGFDPRTRRAFTNIEPVAGGWGARPDGDGPSATFTIGHGDTFNIPIEVLETRYPLMIVNYGLRQDSGGPGRYRGGLGMERVYRVLDNGVFNGLSERSKCPPWGLKGGHSAFSGEIVIRRAKTRRTETYSKVTGLKLGKDDVLYFRTGGGGGFGDPLLRPVDRVMEDVALGHVSVEAAKKHYGVQIDAKSKKVDEAATQKLRKRMKSTRGRSKS
jgi:N-methylhydantoinase B